MGCGRFWKVYFGQHGDVKNEVVEAYTELDAKEVIEKKYSGCSISHILRCNADGDAGKY